MTLKKYANQLAVNIVEQRGGGGSCELPWFAVAIYDMIMGAERLNAWQDHRDGLDWFIEHFPDAYMVLLD